MQVEESRTRGFRANLMTRIAETLYCTLKAKVVINDDIFLLDLLKSLVRLVDIENCGTEVGWAMNHW
jgi:hypothetical protein